MKLSIFILSLCINSTLIIAQFGDQNDISNSTAAPVDAKAFDLDNDGDMDILCASQAESKVSWFENTGGGVFGAAQTISTDLLRVVEIDANDLDGDGDLDILCASQNDHLLVWFKNLGNGSFDTLQIISANVSFPESIYTTDIDNDGDIDVLSASRDDDKVAWYSNNGTGTFGPQQIITTSTDYAYYVYASDIDNDGDMDVLTASKTDKKIAWFENMGGGLIDTTQHIISTNANGANVVYTADLDGDLDLDVLSASSNDGKVSWYQNMGGGLIDTVQINIAVVSGGVKDLIAVDVDGDNDIDILSVLNGNKVVWFENNGNASFGPMQIISTYILSVESIYSADFDQDGDLDILSTSKSDNTIAWHENAGGAVFGTKHQVNYLNAITNRAVYAADMDNDGDMDILSASQYLTTNLILSNPIYAADGKIAWYENLGNKQFSAQKIITTIAGGANDVHAADINGDGDLDIISSSDANAGTDKIAWYENLGNGTFGAQQVIASPINPIKVYSEDLDNDGDMDILYASRYNISWSENWGGGSFSSEQIILNYGGGFVYFSSTVPSDLNNDGYLDIISAKGSMLYWSENLGNGTFGTGQVISTSGSFDVHAADLNNDGDMDIVVANWADDKVAWYENVGSGTFGTQQIISSTADFAYSVYTADIDNDGDLDVLSASSNDDKIAWYENNGNGQFGNEQIISLSLDGATAVHAADLNNDGDTEVIAASLNDHKIVWYENRFISNYQLKGRVFYDENQNGTLDTNELGFSFIPVNIQPNSLVNYSSADGTYFFDIDDTLSTYTLGYTANPLWNLTTDSTSYTASLSNAQPLADSLNFGFYPDTIIQAINAEIIGGFPRCNTLVNYWIYLQNTGTSLASGVIHLQLNDSIDYISSAVLPDSIVGQNLYWHYDSLMFYSSTQINLHVQMPDFNSIGQSLNSHLNVSITDSLGHSIPYSSDTLSPILRCAYDPNDKLATPTGIDSSGYISASTAYIAYTVRFQNTGNDTATSVIILDSLDTNLRWNTLSPLASSHPVQIDLDQSGQVRFNFEYIYLPDSTTNYGGSQGYIKYKVDLKTGLLGGEKIMNKASIYFDQNPPIITNTTTNTIYDCQSPIQFTISDFTSCQNTPLSGNISADLSNSSFNWAIASIYNSSTNQFNWLADTFGVFDLIISTSNSICAKDTSVSLSIYPTSADAQNLSICAGDSVWLGGQYQTANGVYVDSFQSISSCDSLLFTSLSIKPLPNVSLAAFYPDTVCENSNSLALPSATPLGGSYTGNGLSGSFFDPSIAGLGIHHIIYTFVDTNSCTKSDTSTIDVQVCTPTQTLNSAISIDVYPNPCLGLFSIKKTNHLNHPLLIRVTDIHSKLLVQKTLDVHALKTGIDLRDYSAGVYFVHLLTEDKHLVKKILKI